MKFYNSQAVANTLKSFVSESFVSCFIIVTLLSNIASDECNNIVDSLPPPASARLLSVFYYVFVHACLFRASTNGAQFFESLIRVFEWVCMEVVFTY